MRSTREYLRYLNVSLGSTAETHYLIDLAGRLRYLPESERESLVARYTELMKGLQSLIGALEYPKPTVSRPSP